MSSQSAPKTPKSTLRQAIAWVAIGVACVGAATAYKSTLMRRAESAALERLPAQQAKVSGLFQASYYFFYDDQFLPGIQEVLREGVSRIVILSPTGTALFDSSAPRKPDDPQSAARPAGIPDALVQRLGTSVPFVLSRGFQLQIAVPGPQFAIVYLLDGSAAKVRVAGMLAATLAIAALFYWLISSGHGLGALRAARARWRRFWRLRVKFLAAIVVVNLATAVIVFFSLASLQTREQTERIERDSVLFSQFSTAQVISNFTNYFYFYFSDRFIPETKRIIASNENLVGLRIISRRTGGVLYDSDQPAENPAVPLAAGTQAKPAFSAEVEAQLKTRDQATQFIERGGERMLSVVNTFRNESQEPVFSVEYVFAFRTLEKSIRAIRRQILIDLVPSLALGLLIAALFAQWLISPIRRLVAALRKVEGGDYEVSVGISRGDEIGDLVGAFNSMAGELRRKQELRKYLSDSTYRQIMKSPQLPEGARVGGTRVSATVLFSDIRNFVGHCEALEAEEVTAMLNEYFSEMVEVVHKHGGEVDKFIGDAFLAVFYVAPETAAASSGAAALAVSASATALQAVHCSIEMRERLAQFNERRVASGKAPIETGVGITFGELISGPIGAKDRMDFTVIGDVVNLASRIEKLSKKGRHTKIIFSEQVEERVRGLLEYDEMGSEKVAGKDALVRVFELIGVRDIGQLLRNLAGDDVALRRRSLDLLGQSRNPEALEAVLGVLADSDAMIRLGAVVAASRLAEANPLQGEWVFNALEKRLAAEGQGDDKVLSALLSAIGRLAGPARIERMIVAFKPFLASSDERIIANAVEALGFARDARCTDLVLPLLASLNNRVKANAAMALFAAGRIEVIDTLKPMLMHSEALMRASAAFAIGELTMIAGHEKLLERWKERPGAFKYFLADLQESVPMLVTLLRDPDIRVRRQAVLSLGKIKDKSAVLPMIDMLGPEGSANVSSQELIQDISEALRSIGSHKLVREVISKLSAPA
jgi:class 3 adenylate cyclase